MSCHHGDDILDFFKGFYLNYALIVFEMMLIAVMH